jgi:CDP-diacylglycerol--glycerol-3-phosphate 3-phosphatidyltransferase
MSTPPATSVPAIKAANPIGSSVVAGPWERAAPNLLTAARVVLAIAFFGVLVPWKYHKSTLVTGSGPDVWLLVAAGIFVVAALTDVLDGYLARKWNAITTFGRIMDPFADKFLVIGAFVFLAGPGFAYYGSEAVLHLPGRPAPPVGSVTGVTAWMVAVILGRELLVTSIRAEVEGRGLSFAATLSGKLKMILQSVCVPAVLVLMNFRGENGQAPGPIASNAIIAIVWATILVTAWSAVPYVTRGMRVLGPGGAKGAE